MTEPDAESDTRNIKTTAVKDGNEWVINGEKTFITGGNEADFVLVIAITDKETHQKTGRDGVTCFIVDRDMGWKSEYIDTMGEWGPAGLVFDNVRVPEENILGEVHGGYQLGLEWIGFARWVIGAFTSSLEEILEQERITQATVVSTEDHKEGVQAFKEKRKPNFGKADGKVLSQK